MVDPLPADKGWREEKGHWSRSLACNTAIKERTVVQIFQVYFKAFFISKFRFCQIAHFNNAEKDQHVTSREWQKGGEGSLESYPRTQGATLFRNRAILKNRTFIQNDNFDNICINSCT